MLCLTLVSCSNDTVDSGEESVSENDIEESITSNTLLDRKHSKATEQEDMNAILKELDKVDARTLTNAMLWMDVKNIDRNGMTYRDILEQGKVWKQEEDERRAQSK